MMLCGSCLLPVKGDTKIVTRGNKLEFDAESHLAVLNLIKAVPAMSARTGTISETRNFDGFLRPDSPPLETVEPEILPLFPRGRKPGLSRASPGLGRLQSMMSLEAMTKLPGLGLSSVEIKDEEEEDIANEHLKQAGGWGKQLIFLQNPGLTIP